MPKQAKKKTTQDIKINLVPKDPFYDSLLGKGTTWALSVGRYIVIFTELVVILSFISRFQLDRQVTDLNKEIVQKQSVIESYGDLEQNVRDIQRKIDTYNQLKSKKPIEDVFDQLSAITPLDIAYQELTIKTEGLSMTGHTSSSQSLTQFIQNLQQSPYFQNVIVDNITNNDEREPGFMFRIQASTR